MKGLVLKFIEKTFQYVDYHRKHFFCIFDIEFVKTIYETLVFSFRTLLFILKKKGNHIFMENSILKKLQTVILIYFIKYANQRIFI